MRVGILGGTGFVRSYLVDALAARGHQPVLLVRPGSEDRLTFYSGFLPSNAGGFKMSPIHVVEVAAAFADAVANDATLGKTVLLGGCAPSWLGIDGSQMMFHIFDS